MSLLKSFKVRTKFSILIAIMTIGIIIVGITGYYYKSIADQKLSHMYNDNLKTIELLDDTRTQSRANKGNILELILAKDDTTRKNVLADIEKRKKAIDENLMQYEKMGLDAYEKEQYTVIKKNLEAWREILNKTIDLTGAGKSEEAYTLYEQKGNKAFEDLQTSIRAITNYNIDYAEKMYLQNQADSKEALLQIIIVIAFVISTALIIGVYITLSITKPLKKVVALINETSKLNLVYDSSFEYLFKYKDEMGLIAVSVANMRKVLREIAGKVAGMSGNLTSHSEELTASTEEYTKSISQIATAIDDMAQGNSSQAEMVTNINTKISGVTKTIDEVNRLTAMNAENAKKSLETVDYGQQAVETATESMQENLQIVNAVGDSLNRLSEMIHKVSSFTVVVNDIAGQTNLLALNAAIEAARAGEAGKGFAVVSEEIRKLAEGSAAAAKEITRIIQATMEESNATLENMDKARGVVENQSKAIDNTKLAFERIKVAVEEITKKVQETADMLMNVDTIAKEISNQTQDMAAVAEEAAAGSQEISASSEEQYTTIETIAGTASDLSAMAMELNSEISKFKF